MSQVSDKIVSGDGAAAGDVILVQSVTLNANSTNVVDGTITLPPNSEITGFNFRNLTAWDSATSATLSVGITQAGTDYASGLSAKTGGRVADAATAAQETARSNVGSNTVVHATVTPVGATTVGKTLVNVHYRRR